MPHWASGARKTISTQFFESIKYTRPGLRWYHDYLLPPLLGLCSHVTSGARVLDVGCGNGSIAAEMHNRGYCVTGIDMSLAGIRLAKEACPAGRFEVLPADCALLQNLNEQPFDLVYSLEVIEHLYDPRDFMAGCFDATRSGGTFIISTPYHGYLKNLIISLGGRWDRHHDPLCAGGHIKFYSRETLSSLIRKTGFVDLRFLGAGRYPALWKSMLIAATKP